MLYLDCAEELCKTFADVSSGLVCYNWDECTHLPSIWQHLLSDDWLEDKCEHYQNCCTLYCVPQLMAVVCLSDLVHCSTSQTIIKYWNKKFSASESLKVDYFDMNVWSLLIGNANIISYTQTTDSFDVVCVVDILNGTVLLYNTLRDVLLILDLVMFNLQVCV